MLTVIIPTMLLTKHEIFEYTLIQLEQSECVKKIIIIDNTENNNFKNEYTITSKIEVIEPVGNIFVNPAWNLGIEKTESKYYLLLNDDIILNTQILNNCINILETTADSALITVNTENNLKIKKFEKINKNIEKQKVEFKNIGDERQGWFIFGRKSLWVEIPDEIKLLYGDDFIYQYHKLMGYNNYIVTNNTLSHFCSSSWQHKSMTKIKHPYYYSDKINFEKAIQKLKGNIK